MKDIEVGDRLVFWGYKLVKRKNRFKSTKKRQRIRYMDPPTTFTVTYID